MTQLDIYTAGVWQKKDKTKHFGGWAAILVCEKGKKELSGAASDQSQHKMELIACIESLKAIKAPNVTITIYSSSEYIVNCVKYKWYKSWKNNGWKTKEGKEVKNQELWMKLIQLVERLNVTFKQVNNGPNDESARAYHLAKKAIENYELEQLSNEELPEWLQ